jgi:GYF domain 2
MPVVWYYAQSERAVGPLELQVLQTELAKTANWRDVLVWRKGFDGWQKAGTVDEIVERLVEPQPIPRSAKAPTGSSKDVPGRSNKGWAIGLVLAGIAGVVAIVVGAAFGKAIGKAGYEFAMQLGKAGYERVVQRFEKSVAQKIEHGFQQAEQRLRPTLPKKIDDVTTLIGIGHDGLTMIYDNRLEVEGSRIDDATKAEMRDQVTRAVCGKAEMTSTLRFGASYRYTYVDSKDEPLMSIDVGEKECAQIDVAEKD